MIEMFGYFNFSAVQCRVHLQSVYKSSQIDSWLFSEEIYALIREN